MKERTDQRDQRVDGHREEPLKPRSDESKSALSTQSVVHGGVKSVDVHHAECDAAWPCSHGSVVKLIEIRDTDGESWTHSRSCGKNCEKDERRAERVPCQGWEDIQCSDAGGKEPREHGAMPMRPCAVRHDERTKHKRHALA